MNMALAFDSENTQNNYVDGHAFLLDGLRLPQVSTISERSKLVLKFPIISENQKALWAFFLKQSKVNGNKQIAFSLSQLIQALPYYTRELLEADLSFLLKKSIPFDLSSAGTRYPMRGVTGFLGAWAIRDSGFLQLDPVIYIEMTAIVNSINQMQEVSLNDLRFNLLNQNNDVKATYASNSVLQPPKSSVLQHFLLPVSS